MRTRTQLIASDVKARANFVAIVSDYTPLRRHGRQYLGLCPFHSERRPSFYIHEDKKVFHCFGCGAGGDVFAFVMRAEGYDFRCALETVARLSTGVARASAPRSGARLGASEGAAPLAAKRPGFNSQSSEHSRSQVLARLEAINRRLAAIDTTNRAASLALATACEPDRGSPFT
jgi:CHC2 zinc finger